MPSFPSGFYAGPTEKTHNFTTFSELTLGSTTESGYTSEVPFNSSLITPVEEPCPVSSTTHLQLLSLKLPKLGLISGFLAIALSLASIFGIFGTNNYASAAELIATSPGVGSTLSAVPAQVIFGFDGPLETFGTALYVNGKRVTVGVAERGRDAQEAILGLNGLNVAGTYEVFWEATAVDKSVSSGKIRFVVKASSRKLPAEKPAPTVPATTPTLPVNPLPGEAPINQGGTSSASAPPLSANPAAAGAEVTPATQNPAAVTPAATPTPDPAATPTQITIVVTTIVNTPTNPARPTRAPRATKAPKSIPPETTGSTATLANEATVPSATATTNNGTPSRQRPAGTTADPTVPAALVPVSKVKVKGTSIIADDPVLPAKAATTPTLELSNPSVAKPSEKASKSAQPTKPANPTKLDAPKISVPATGSAEIVFAPPIIPVTEPAARGDRSVGGSNPVEPTAPVVPPTIPPATNTRPKPTTTTILLSPDTVPASDIEVSVEDPNGSTVNDASAALGPEPTTTRKKRPSITDALEGTTVVPIDASTFPSDAANAAATTVLVTGGPNDPNDLNAPQTTLPAADSVATAAAPVTTLDRPRTEAEIVSGTDAISPNDQDAAQASGTVAASPKNSQSSHSSSLQTGRLRQPLKFAGAGALAALLVGLLALFASLRAPITAFARQRWLSLFGSVLALAILVIGTLALARELVATPKSWSRVGLKALGFSALTAFALVRRRSMKRGLSILSDILPSAKNVRVPASAHAATALSEIDEQVPKSLRLGGPAGQRSKGRHVPELVRRLRKASLVEAIFGAVAIAVAAVLLFV